MNLNFNQSTKTRLDQYLAKRLPLSRIQIQKAIKDGFILIDNKKTKPSFLLNAPCLISIDESILHKNEQDDLKISEINIPVIFEDENILVINKPRGIPVHPDAKYHKDTVVNWLLGHCPAIKNIGEDLMRPGIIHRLDKETSGVMVIAKNQKYFKWLKKAFQDRKIQKKYLALVEGSFPEKIKIISLALGRSPKKGKQVALTSLRAAIKNIKSREAETEFRIIKKFKNYTLLEASPKTGRTHQIRAHLSSSGHPIFGDILYNKKSVKNQPMFLHAKELSFFMPNGQKKLFNAPLPEDLFCVLKNLEK